MMFWIISAAISLVVIICLLFPLFRGEKVSTKRSNFDENVYHDQLSEIDHDLDRGVINVEEAKNARLEVERRLLKASSDESMDTHKPIPKWANKLTLGATTVSIFGGAFALYFLLGVPGMPSFALANRGAELQEAQQEQQVKKMVNRLATRLESAPNDPDGWARLGRSYQVMGRMDESKQAYEKAYRLKPENNDFALAYVESLMFETKGQSSPEAKELLEKVLDADPENFKARFYQGISLATQPDTLKEAVEIWVQLLKESPKNAPWVPFLKEQIEQNAPS